VYVKQSATPLMNAISYPISSGFSYPWTGEYGFGTPRVKLQAFDGRSKDGVVARQCEPDPTTTHLIPSYPIPFT
jgi:hypothetical protein